MMLNWMLWVLKNLYRRSSSPFARRLLQVLSILVWIGKVVTGGPDALADAWDVLASLGSEDADVA